MKKFVLLSLLAFLNCSCMIQTGYQSITGVISDVDTGSIDLAADHLPGDCTSSNFPESLIHLSLTSQNEMVPGRRVEVSLKSTDPICPVHGTIKKISPAKEFQSVKISPELAHELLLKNSNIRLIDVRLLSEYQQLRIPNSERFTYLQEDPERFIKQMEEKYPDKDEIIMIYCRTGNRSHAAAEYLTQSGYTNVLDLGGIEEWNYEIEKGQ